MAEQFLTVAQAAQRLQVHPYTLRRYLREGKIRATKISRHYRIAESALTQMAKVEKVESVTQTALAGAARQAAIMDLVGKYPPKTTNSSIDRLFAERRLEVARDEAKFQERRLNAFSAPERAR